MAVIGMAATCMYAWFLNGYSALLRSVEENIGCEQLRTVGANFCWWFQIGTCHNVEWTTFTDLEIKGRTFSQCTWVVSSKSTLILMTA